jgi:hypothetical protein
MFHWHVAVHFPRLPSPLTKKQTLFFYGEVVQVTRTRLLFNRHNAETLKVKKSFKRSDENTVVVYTRNNSAMCGVNFEIGKNYLIYGYVGASGKKNDEKIYTFLCSRTKEFSFDDDSFILKAHEERRDDLSREKQFYLDLEEKKRVESSKQ